LSSEFIDVQASAQSAPTLGSAAAIIAQVDLVAQNLPARDAAAYFRLPARKTSSDSVNLNVARQVNLLVEDTLHNLSDADFVFSIPTVIEVRWCRPTSVGKRNLTGRGLTTVPTRPYRPGDGSPQGDEKWNAVQGRGCPRNC